MKMLLCFEREIVNPADNPNLKMGRISDVQTKGMRARCPRSCEEASLHRWAAQGNPCRKEKEPTLAGTILIGGTALALRIGHRRSYDLDFCLRAPRLLGHQIEGVIEALAATGISAQRSDDPTAYDEFLNAGMSLHDYQQDFLTSTDVKLTFFADDPAVAALLHEGLAEGPRLASLEEIFQLKALLSAKRSTSRDWFDLFVLMNHHGFTVQQFADAFHRAAKDHSLDIAFNRLCSGRTAPDDPGFEAVSEHPPTIEEMRDDFIDQRNRFEIESARKAKGR